MPEEEDEEQETQPEPVTEPDEFTQLTGLMQKQMGLSDRTQAANILGNILKKAGVGQGQAKGVLEKMTNILNDLPQDMSMARASADQKLSNEIQGQGQGNIQQEAMGVLRPMMPYLMAFKMLDMFGNQGQQNKSGIEDLLLKKTVEEKFGETQPGSDKLDEISGELKKLNTQYESGNINRGTAIDELSEKAEEVQEQMSKMEDLAETVGYSPDNQGTLDKVMDVSEKINKLLGNLRESAPSPGRGGQKPERKVKKAGEEPESEASPEERPGNILDEEEEKPIPVQKEEPEKEVSEAESEPEEETQGRERDKKGRFVPEDKTSEESEESEE